jgi:hypothetical protein
VVIRTCRKVVVFIGISLVRRENRSILYQPRFTSVGEQAGSGA